MSIFLSLEEIRFELETIKAEYNAVINHRWFSARKNSKQWQFLRHSFSVLTGEAEGDYPCSEKQAAQYKHEVSDRLNRYYLSFGRPIKFIFTLVHEKNDGLSEYEEAVYPSSNGYLLRVSYNSLTTESSNLKRLLLEKTVVEAIDAEWAVYQNLPDVDLTPLDKVFDRNGAYKKIERIATANTERGWTLKNKNNPSTKRLVDIKIEKMAGSNALVRTSEYWYLAWWSIKDERYEHTYKEVNRQKYMLVWKNDHWMITENIYPPPKFSTPRRNIRAAKLK